MRKFMMMEVHSSIQKNGLNQKFSKMAQMRYYISKKKDLDLWLLIEGNCGL